MYLQELVGLHKLLTHSFFRDKLSLIEVAIFW